jgi:hypothetical protein
LETWQEQAQQSNPAGTNAGKCEPYRTFPQIPSDAAFVMSFWAKTLRTGWAMAGNGPPQRGGKAPNDAAGRISLIVAICAISLVTCSQLPEVICV